MAKRPRTSVWIGTPLTGLPCHGEMIPTGDPLDSLYETGALFVLAHLHLQPSNAKERGRLRVTPAGTQYRRHTRLTLVEARTDPIHHDVAMAFQQ